MMQGVEFAASKNAAPAEWGTHMVANLRDKYAQMKVQRMAALQQDAHAAAKVQIMAETPCSPSKVTAVSPPPTPPRPIQTPQRIHTQHAPAAAPQPQPITVQTPTSSTKFSMADYEIGRVVGAGSFGRVYIAKHKPTGQVHAIKCMSKAACIQGGQVKHVMDERRLLIHMRHPFIVQLLGTFQDAACIYLVMEFVPGGEFFTLLREKGRMREEHARFYAANIILALEYLHSHHILYRDLKPENLLVGGDGYIRMTDMGFAKVVAGKTYTMCGTPDYMAPEIVLNKGHTKAVDWWSLGCVIYEMLHGFPPFFTGKSKETYQKILNPASLVFPDSFSSLAKDLLQGLLTHEPEMRLGIRGRGVQEIKESQWFGGFDWGYIYKRMYRPPHIPKVSGTDEACNFDGLCGACSSEPPVQVDI